MQREDDVRDAASGWLGRELTDSEWRDAYPAAQSKLKRIIESFGDLDGERLKPYYLGQLVVEQLRERTMSRITLALYNDERRQQNDFATA